MSTEENIELTTKQLLILFFIETGFADNDYKLVKHLDRSNFFPAELDENMATLFKHRLIKTSGYLDNGSPFKYAITERGTLYLDQHLKRSDLMDFAEGYSSHGFIMEIIPALLKKRIAEGKI